MKLTLSVIKADTGITTTLAALEKRFALRAQAPAAPRAFPVVEHPSLAAAT